VHAGGGDRHRRRRRVHPINLTYKGHAKFVEKNEAERRAVIDARGRDARGNGTAAAVVTATLADAGGTTNVKVHTDLDITGKPAQFGRGVMVDVGNKLIGQFADALANTIRAGDAGARPAAASGSSPTTSPTAGEAEAAAGAPAGRARPKPSRPAAPADESAASAAEAGVVDASADRFEAAGLVNGHPARSARAAHADVEPIDLLHHAGPAVAKRLAPVAVALLVVLVAVRRHRQHGSS
jgi:carbon monoxide dehydrogenase subunit G